ncbi:MAG TPA: DUF202 domain-containing protein [Candidatus Baltobacteraceae bacterium]|jgi:putative membrane protein|nr:DUF202 domain-containing protein [Candidatus Baltobacteraceae bacterium]
MADESQVRPTDALANERTYLAYLRTALAFIGFGFVIARFSLFAREFAAIVHVTIPARHVSTTFGTLISVVGVLVALYGSFRYAQTEKALTQRKMAPMPVSAAYTGGIVVALIGSVVALDLFAVR